MQVVNANNAARNLEVSTDGGSSFKGTTRQVYNYWEDSSGFGADTFTVRVTCSSGKQVDIRDVDIASETFIYGIGQLLAYVINDEYFHMGHFRPILII